jgi:DNA-directed RNA polymerase subunit K
MRGYRGRKNPSFADGHWEKGLYHRSVFTYILMVAMSYTRFEKARIIGARALQISMGAPILVEPPEELIDPIDIATLEFQRKIIPITVKRTM